LTTPNPACRHDLALFERLGIRPEPARESSERPLAPPPVANALFYDAVQA
ncbi:MAG: biotin synthase, partial [Gammaproteobacteria bacterium]